MKYLEYRSLFTYSLFHDTEAKNRPMFQEHYIFKMSHDEKMRHEKIICAFDQEITSYPEMLEIMNIIPDKKEYFYLLRYIKTRKIILEKHLPHRNGPNKDSEMIAFICLGLARNIINQCTDEMSDDMLEKFIMNVIDIISFDRLGYHVGHESVIKDGVQLTKVISVSALLLIGYKLYKSIHG